MVTVTLGVTSRLQLLQELPSQRERRDSSEIPEFRGWATAGNDGFIDLSCVHAICLSLSRGMKATILIAQRPI